MVAMPSNELVLMYWLRSRPSLPTNSISTTLPKGSTWAASGFIQVAGVGGGSDPHIPVHSPVMSIDTWANVQNSERPDWEKASILMEQVRWEMYQRDTRGALTISGYYSPFLTCIYPVSNPRRIPSDEAYAHISMDVEIDWHALRDVA